jgi:hypothetical protein
VELRLRYFPDFVAILPIHSRKLAASSTASAGRRTESYQQYLYELFKAPTPSFEESDNSRLLSATLELMSATYDCDRFPEPLLAKFFVFISLLANLYLTPADFDSPDCSTPLARFRLRRPKVLVSTLPVSWPLNVSASRSPMALFRTVGNRG